MAKQILLIGIGQLGCTVAERFWRASSRNITNVRVLAIDTDARTLEHISGPSVISLAQPCLVEDILDELDNDVLKEWFPCDKQKDFVEFFECISMNEGANQWRMKSLLALTHFLSKPANARLLNYELDEIAESFDPDDSKRELDVQVIASLAGGTGSGLFLPITLYVRHYLQEKGVKVQAQALLALPEICEQFLTAEQRIKAQANAYAAIREINAINHTVCGTNPCNTPNIGSADDPYLGLLFDHSASKGNADALPFKQIYLFRRNPGVRSITLHIDFLTDAARFLCDEGSISTPNTPDAVISGLNISRSIYPVDSIVSYISLASLYNTASEQWSFLYDQTAKELAAQRARAAHSGVSVSDKPAENIMQAVMDIAQRLCADKKNDSTLLDRHYDDPDDDTSPEMRFPPEYPSELINIIRAETADSNSAALDELLFLEEQRAEKEQRRKRRLSSLPSKKRKANVCSVAEKAMTLLKDQYSHVFSMLSTGPDSLEKQLFDKDSPLSVTETILKDNGKPIHPGFALVRLCNLYSNIQKALEESMARNREEFKRIASPELPGWIIEADVKTFIHCPYHVGKERLARLLTGDSAHLKGRRDEEKLFYYDLALSHARIKDAYLCARGLQLLDVLGKQIIFHFELLKSITDDAAELSTDVDAALHAFTSECSSFYYYVGASEHEKKTALSDYAEYLKQNKLQYKYEAELDQRLGSIALEHNPSVKDNAKPAKRLLYELIELIHGQCHDSGFYSKTLDRNILDVIMSQTGQNDTDSVDLALSRALLPRCLPLLYVIPDSRKNFPEALLVKNATRAAFPRVTEQYIADNPQLFDQKEGVRAINELLFHAGEYEADADFYDRLCDREISVCRKISNLKPAYIEAFNEYSESPIYYRSYLKALKMQEMQLTEMWNPHLIRGFSAPDALPLISFRPPEQTPSCTES